ncbi:MAG: penicillin-binding transpeptidase domain-containing protein [Bacteroidota bacterium]
MRFIVALLLALLAGLLAWHTVALSLPEPLTSPTSPSLERQVSYPVPQPRPDFARAFEDEGVDGTFVLAVLSGEPLLDAAAIGIDRLQVHNLERATTRYLPASTFKIPNALVALESGVVADSNEVFVWDGVERFASAWNQDLTLGPALRASAVWVFQDIARRVGEDRMQGYVDRLGYGNLDISGGIDLFWLNGGLRISALEQITLLEGLARGSLPFSSPTQKAVRSMMTVERGVLTDGTPYVLRAKTGWANAPEPDIGWWVGYVEHTTPEGPRRWAFALNIAMPEGGDDAPKRIRIARTLLESEGLVPTR